MDAFFPRPLAGRSRVFSLPFVGQPADEALSVAAPVRTAERVLAFDGVRGLACLLVLSFNLCAVIQSPTWPTAFQWLGRLLALNWCGVDLFLVLSGYLLGGICLAQRNSPNYFRVFYIRRAVRILPLYYLWFALWLVLPFVVGGVVYKRVFTPEEPAWPYAVFLQNIVFAERGSYGSIWMVVTWSLAVEEQFYLILPGLIRWMPTRHLPRVLLGLIAVAPLARAVVMFALPPSQAMAAFWLLPCRWDAMFLGVLAAFLTRDEAGKAWVREHLRLLRFGTIAVGLAVAAVFVLGPDKRNPVTAIVGYSVIDLFFVGVVLLARYDTAVSWLLSLRPLVGLGCISYGVYLFHFGILSLFQGRLLQGVSEVHDAESCAVLAMALLATVGLAWLSFRYFESVWVRLGQKWRYQLAAGEAPAQA